MMKIRVSIFTTIVLFGVITALGLCAILAVSSYANSQLRVGGPLYTQIKLGNDLIADILPPPAYVIEAYLEATLALREPKALDEHEQKLQQLRKDYEDRKAFWSASALQPALKSALVETSDAQARKFWQVLASELVPAVRAGDAAKAEAAYGRLTEAYSAHRKVIDD